VSSHRPEFAPKALKAAYVLVCVARDLQAVQSFVNGALLKAANVDSVRTSLILSDVKADPEIPLP
jgi:hypothetical protein